LKSVIFNFSPSLKGSSAFITNKIYKFLTTKNFCVEIINVHQLKILPCGNCSSFCYKYGKCKIKTDEMGKIYKVLTKQHFFVFVTPVYFYHIPGYAKIMIDRCQPYWVRKYVLKNFSPNEKLGILICIAATKGKKLFSGINLTIKYFFDIFNIRFDKKYNLYLRNVETLNDINKHNTEIEKYLNYLSLLIDKKKILATKK